MKLTEYLWKTKEGMGLGLLAGIIFFWIMKTKIELSLPFILMFLFFIAVGSILDVLVSNIKGKSIPMSLKENPWMWICISYIGLLLVLPFVFPQMFVLTLGGGAILGGIAVAGSLLIQWILGKQYNTKVLEQQAAQQAAQQATQQTTTIAGISPIILIIGGAFLVLLLIK